MSPRPFMSNLIAPGCLSRSTQQGIASPCRTNPPACAPRYADVPFTSNLSKYVRFAASDVAGIVDDDLFEGRLMTAEKLSLKKQKLDAIGY